MYESSTHSYSRFGDKDPCPEPFLFVSFLYRLLLTRLRVIRLVYLQSWILLRPSSLSARKWKREQRHGGRREEEKPSYWNSKEKKINRLKRSIAIEPSGRHAIG